MTVDKRYCECENPNGFAEFEYRENEHGEEIKICKDCGQEWFV